MASGAGNITVAVRVRPLSSKETSRGCHACIVVQDARQVNVVDPDDKMGGIDYLRLDKTKDKAYAFDHAFEPGVPGRDAKRSSASTSDGSPAVASARTTGSPPGVESASTCGVDWADVDRADIDAGARRRAPALTGAGARIAP